MASNTRQQLEGWLKTKEITGSVIDVGGIHAPIVGRTKTWDVTEYKLLDVKKSHKGYKADYVKDLNNTITDIPEFDNVFIIEVMSHIYDPIEVIRNCNRMCKMRGRLFVSVHLFFPRHQGLDCLRYTEQGLVTILRKCGFEPVDIKPKTTINPEALEKYVLSECKVYLQRQIIGTLVEAIKINGLE